LVSMAEDGFSLLESGDCDQMATSQTAKGFFSRRGDT